MIESTFVALHERPNRCADILRQPLLYPPEGNCLIVPEVKHSIIRELRYDFGKAGEYPWLFRRLIRPKGVKGLLVLGHDQSADKIVRIAVRQAFNVQIHLAFRFGERG